ncbi:MAG: hypothetical protein AAB463_00985 [Patescibacteria group bacterium]
MDNQEVVPAIKPLEVSEQQSLKTKEELEVSDEKQLELLKDRVLGVIRSKAQGVKKTITGSLDRVFKSFNLFRGSIGDREENDFDAEFSLNSEEIDQLAGYFEEQVKDITPGLIGLGAEKKIYQHPLHPDRVIGEYNEDHPDSVRKAKARFYFYKILNTLLLDYFPRMILAAEKRFEASRLDGDPYKKLRDRLRQNRGHLNPTQIDRVLEKLHVMEEGFRRTSRFKKFQNDLWSLGIAADANRVNFFDATDGLKYVDTIDPWLNRYSDGALVPNFNPEQLLQIIESLPDEQRARTRVYYERLVGLLTEEREITMPA